MIGMVIFVYCTNQRLVNELGKELLETGCDFEVFENSTEIVNQTIEEQPEVVVLYLDREDQWAEVGISAIRKACYKTKIIYISMEPSKADAKILEQGFYYYGGNSSAKEILEAVKAAISQTSRLKTS